jgi:predicted nucleic acid-binding protein
MAAPAPPLPASLVLDTSVVVASAFREIGRYRLADDIIARVRAGDVAAYVTQLFWAEFQHACAKKLRAHAFPLSEVEAAYEAVQRLGLEEVSVLAEYRQDAWDLVRRFAIDSYDAYGIALALAMGREFWCFDQPLCDRLTADPALRRLVRLVGVDVTW